MANFVFPKVEPADIQRSRRDLSVYKTFTGNVGTLIPCLNLEMLPDDWMRINTIATVQTLPMVAPVKGRWKCSFDFYYNPWSNIYGYMDGNTRLSTQAILNQYRYIFKLGYRYPGSSWQDFQQDAKVAPKVPRGGLLDMLGCPVGYFGDVQGAEYAGEVFPIIAQSEHPAEGVITYLDIVRNYYVNNQESVVPYISDDRQSNGEYGSHIDYATWSLEDLDNFIQNLRYNSRNGLSAATEFYAYPTSYSNFYRVMVGDNGADLEDGSLASQLGLCLRTYRMDLLRGTMSSSVGEFKSNVVVNSNTFNMDQVYFANKLQTLINRIDPTGGRFTDWMRTRWNVDPGIEVDRPIYLGSHSLWLNTIDVVATASGANDVDSRNNTSILGQQVGYQVGKLSIGQGKDRQRPITIKSKQYGTLMCIFSIVPDVVYSQGFELNMLKTKFSDIYDPAFKQLGYQDVLRGEMYAFPIAKRVNTHLFDLDSGIFTKVGKRVAWSEYMAQLNRSHGDFAYGQPLDYWVNNRIYAGSHYPIVENGNYDAAYGAWVTVLHDFDMTSYVYPHLWTSQFADTSIASMNYHIDVFFQIDANRSLGKRLMPHM